MKISNKLYRTAIVFSIIAVVVLAVVFAITEGAENNIQTPEQKNGEVLQVGYIVRLEGNHVNVYEQNGEAETYNKTIVGVNVFDLPEKTLNSLRKGVAIKDEAQLSRLVEEITS